MARYIKKFAHVGAIGPTEERGFAVWAGYDIVGIDDDLSSCGLTRVEGWSDDQLAQYGVTTFTPVQPDDKEMYAKLGIGTDR